MLVGIIIVFLIMIVAIICVMIAIKGNPSSTRNEVASRTVLTSYKGE